MSIDAVLLDIDGTLIDSNESHVIAWYRAFRESDLNIAPESIRKQIGKGADMLIPALAPDLSHEKVLTIAKRQGEIFKGEFLATVRPFPCAHDLIRALHESGREVVLASSSAQAEVDYYVEILGVNGLLRGTTSSDEVESSKPAADIFARALQKTAVRSASATIVIGDTPYDVIAAAKCDMRSIALRSGGFTDDELLCAQPLAIYEDVSDLLVCLPLSPLSDEI